MKGKLLLFLLVANHCALLAQTIDSVVAADATIYFESNGKGDPVYILTGGPGITPDYMNPVFTELANNNMVVMIHQRGTGKTKIPVNTQTMQIEKYCEDIRAIKNKLNHKKIILLGHSWGGMLAMQYLTLYPNDVSKALLVSSGGYNVQFYSYFGDNIYSSLSNEDQNTARIIGEQLDQLRKKQMNGEYEKELHALSTTLNNILVRGYVFDKSIANQIHLNLDQSDSQVLQLLIGSLFISQLEYKGSIGKNQCANCCYTGPSGSDGPTNRTADS